MGERGVATSLAPADLARVQRRTVGVLSAAQVLGGIAFGATISLGAVLAADISGDETFSGLAAAAVTFGTALIAIPLATLARGRDLSIVVWATTIGAVLGPNLTGPGEVVGQAIGMPPLTGPYVFTVVGQVLGIALYLVALRPDPLLLAQRVVDAASTESRAQRIARPDQPRVARYAIFAIAAAHGVMVAVMAMTPVHLLHHGATLPIIGVTLSLHIAGMYALSPVFGILADRLGR